MSQNARPAQSPEKQGMVHGPTEAPEKWEKPPQPVITPCNGSFCVWEVGRTGYVGAHKWEGLSRPRVSRKV